MKVTLEEMPNVAKELVQNLTPLSSGAHVVALSGNLGAGKTTLTQHLAATLGITEQITSPTFVLMKQYPLTNQRFAQLVHIDAYRLETPEELNTLRINDIFSDTSNLVLIEWPKQVASLLPENKTNITLTVVDDASREITISYAKEN